MQNWQGLIVFFLIVGVPALKQVADYLQRKKEARAIDKVRERREYETLRTGSPASSQSGPSARSGPSPQTRPASQYTQTGQVNAADRLREIQAKRREALERARRHANAGADIAIGVATTGQPPFAQQGRAARSAPVARSAPGARPAPSGPRITQGGSRQPVSGPLIGGRAPLPSRQPARSSTPQQRTGPKPRSMLKAAPPIQPLISGVVKRKRSKHAKLGDHSTVHRLVANAEKGAIVEQSHSEVSPSQLASMSPSDWRRALVLQEVLSEPIALRDES